MGLSSQSSISLPTRVKKTSRAMNLLPGQQTTEVQPRSVVTRKSSRSTQKSSQQVPAVGQSQMLPVRSISVGPTAEDLAIIEMEMYNAREELGMLQITGVMIDILSHEEIVKMTDRLVINRPTSNNSEPYTVNDPRMGSLGPVHCFTCKLLVDCPGHYGRIEFAKPIFNPIFINDKTITQILNCICGGCFMPYLTAEKMVEKGINNYTGARRLAELSKMSEKQPCLNNAEIGDPNIRPCGDNIKFDHAESKSTGRAAYSTGTDSKGNKIYRYLDTERVLDIFRHISDDSARLLGFADSSTIPRLIMQSMLVPPLQTRQPKIIKGVANANDLTIILNKIVVANIALAEAISKAANRTSLESSVPMAAQELYKLVDEYQKKIRDEVQGKDALVRGLSTGKRGNYCARAVISPAIDIALDEIIIPMQWASVLTQTEKVTADNVEWLNKLLHAGRVTYVTPVTGQYAGNRRQVLKGRESEYHLNTGDKVERWLQNGDWLNFNRQPTLHKQNLMAFKTRLEEGRYTIGIHLSITTAMNADFDGDEGSVWPPLSVWARMEAQERMFVCRNLMTGQSNKPIISLVYDSITAVYLLTQPNDDGTPLELPIHTIYDAHMTYISTNQLATLDERLAIFGIPRNSGVALFSSLLPQDFDYENADVKIKKGVLISGVLKSENVGNAHRSIVQDLNKFYGWERAAQFISDSTWALRIFLNRQGFSIGISDCEYGTTGLVERPLLNEQGKEVLDEQGKPLTTRVPIRKVLNQIVAEAEAANMALGPPRENPIEERDRERRIIEIVDGAKGEGIRATKSAMPVRNAIRIMSKQGAGAKGSEFNNLQIGSFLGQQYYSDKRIERSLGEGTRASPLFKEGDYSLAAQGFITHSFMEGLTPAEMFMHFQGSREGLSDTATKVSKVGELQRRIIKAMESITTFPDGSVRNFKGLIYQFKYGEDGFDPAESLKVTTPSQPELASFVDLKTLANQYNADCGWVKVSDDQVLQDPRESQVGQGRGSD